VILGLTAEPARLLPAGRCRPPTRGPDLLGLRGFPCSKTPEMGVSPAHLKRDALDPGAWDDEGVGGNGAANDTGTRNAGTGPDRKR